MGLVPSLLCTHIWAVSKCWSVGKGQAAAPLTGTATITKVMNYDTLQ